MTSSRYSSGSRANRDKIRIIDHEPLAQKAGEDRPSFGKRQTESAGHARSDEWPARPHEKNGISAYFFNRVRERQADRKFSDQHSRFLSAIRPAASAGDLDDSQTRLPINALAAVFALAIAIPAGFIWLSESLNNPTIDPTTTASISAAKGLSVEDVSMTRILKNGTFVVTVSGKITNAADKTKSLLPLTISLLDEEGGEVQSWRHRPGKGVVQPDGSLFFRTSAIDFSGQADTAHVVARTVK